MRPLWQEKDKHVWHHMCKCKYVCHALLSKLLVLCGFKMHLCNRYFVSNLGAIAISVVPLLADYVNHKSRGTCAAFLVLMSSLGALASAYINFTLLNNIGGDSKIFYQYGVICSIIIILGLAYTCFCLKSGNEYYSKNANQRRTFK